MTEILNNVSELSSNQLIPVALLFVCGLLLWGAGRRVMRIGFPAAGFLIGGIMGWSFGKNFDIGVEAWIAGLSSGVVFTIVVALSYRLAVAAAVGLLMATLAPMGVSTAQERNLLAFVQPAEDVADPAVEQPILASPGVETDGDGVVPPGGELAPAGEATTETPVDAGESLAGLVDEAREHVAGFVESQAAEAEGVAIDDDNSDVEEAIRRPFEILAGHFREGWDEAAPGLRGLFAASVFIGAMIGFIIGGLAPGFSATVVSALGGSFLLLTTGSVLAARGGFAAEASFMQSATFWTVVWLVISVIGLGIQSIFRPRSADKSAS